MKNTEEFDFGNWIPKKLIISIIVFSLISAIIAFSAKYFFNNNILMGIFSIIAIVILVYALYMLYCYHIFSFTGRMGMKRIHRYVLSFLPDEMEGRIIDIGCGSGALSIELAKKYPKADILGLDYWGMAWDYSMKQCINNAKIANLDIEFQRGDASKLEFIDESFDMAVSNFVFHEVKSVEDKKDLIIEALRIVKKGGFFAFHDLFEVKSFYDDIEGIIEKLREEGIEEIHYIPNTEKLIDLPSLVKSPFMLRDLGLIYGRK